MKIPFCLPLIDQGVIDEVNDTLTNTGWLTTGPKVIAFEKELQKITNTEKVLCVNSWNSGTALMLKWWGIKEDDEVIIPAYTYSATAMCPLNLGANVKMVDVGSDFNIDIDKLRAAITSKTKAIIPVDIGGNPCDYDQIMELVNDPQIKKMFSPETDVQKKLERILVIADAAHSIGAIYKGKPSGSLTDLSVFSFHSVKNITTGEGGAVCLNLPKPFDNQEVYKFLKHFYLYGQSKSALDKTKVGSWRYDIVSQGMKANLSDIAASIGLSQIRRYESTLLPERKAIFEKYNEKFGQYEWAELPPYHSTSKTSSCHLYQMRFKGISERQRDELILEISQKGVGLSVHYIPMAMLTFFKKAGYDIADFPSTYDNYAREISLPIYNGLNQEQIDYIMNTVIDAYEKLF